MVFFVTGCLNRVKFSSSLPSWDVDVHRDYDLKVGGLCLPPCYTLTKPGIDLLCVIVSLRSWERHGWGTLSLVFFSNYCLLTPSSTSLSLMLGSVCDSLQSGLTAGGRAKLEQRGLSIPGNMGSPAVSWLLMALSTLGSLLSSLFHMHLIFC